MQTRIISTAVAGLLAAATPVVAQNAQATTAFELPAGPLGAGLARFAEQSGLQILYPAALVAGRRNATVSGRFTAEDALSRLLEGSGLAYRRTRPDTFVVYDPAAQRTGLDEKATVVDDVVVTGSYLAGAASPSPVKVVGRDALDRQGRATFAETLAAMPQNFGGAANEMSAGNGADRSSANVGYATGVNLRGLGADATLVLVNGRRVAGTGIAGDFADISNLPSSAIEKVDVLLDGASALYGSDAVGGVVNVILRKDMDGMETRARIGGTSDGGAAETLASHTLGRSWGSGSLLVSYEYYRRGEIRAGQREATTSADLRRFGGTDRREIYAAPGNIMRFDPVTGALLPAWAIPAGQNGTGLTPGDLEAGAVNLSNQNEGRWSLPRQKRHSAYAAIRQEVGRGFEVDADLRVSDRSFDMRGYADIALMTVTADNPFFVSPDGSVSSDIAYSFIRDLGAGRDSGRSRSFGGSAGLTGEAAGWNLAAYATGAREIVTTRAWNRVNQTFLSEALGTSPDDPSTPFRTATDGFFNPYGDPADNSRAVLDFIGSAFSSSRGESTVASANLKADRSLFEFPGGPLRMAVGLDFRRETFESQATNFYFGTSPTVGRTIVNERDISAAFIEVRAPFVGVHNARPGLERLELSLAGRVEHYEDIGSTANPKIGLIYAPHADLMLRVSYGESFRAPSLPELNSRYQLGPTVLPRGSSNVVSIIQYGGNPDLDPETARSITAGAVWTPAAVQGLRVEANWFRTTFRNRISQPTYENLEGVLDDPSLAPFVRFINPASSPADLALIESLLAEPGNFAPDAFPATAYGAVVDARYVNAASVEVEGVDLAARYRFDTPAGSVSLSGDLTWLTRFERQVTPASAVIDLVGQPTYPMALRARTDAAWTRGALTLSAAANYVDGGHDPTSGRDISSWLTFDAQARYDFPDSHGLSQDLSLTLNVINLANDAPPFYDSPRGIAYDASNANMLGRQISLQLLKRW